MSKLPGANHVKKLFDAGDSKSAKRHANAFTQTWFKQAENGTTHLLNLSDLLAVNELVQQHEFAKDDKCKRKNKAKRKATTDCTLKCTLPPKLFEQARDAVYWTPGLTLTGLCERGIRTEVAKLQRKRRKPFPKRKAELKGGRPVGS